MCVGVYYYFDNAKLLRIKADVLLKNELKKIGRNMLWNSIGSLFYLGCQWFLTVLIVRFGNNYKEAGILALSMSISTVLWGIATLNLRTFQISELDCEFSDGDFLLNRIVASSVSLLICMVFVMINGYELEIALCVVSFMIFKISEGFADTLHGIDQKAWRLDIAGKSFLLRGIVTLICFILGELIFHSLLVSIVLMNIGVYAIIICFDFRLCKKYTSIGLKADRTKFPALMKVGVLLGGYAVLLNLIPVIPRFWIERVYGETTLGIFSSVSAPTVLIPQLTSFVFNPLVAIFAGYRKEGNKSGVKKLFLACFLVIGVIGLAAIITGFLLGELALVFLFGESIREYSYLLFPIILTAILTAIIWLLCGLLTVYKDFIWIAKVTFISVCFSALTSRTLVSQNCFMGAILSTAFGLLLECVFLWMRLHHLLKYTNDLTE